MTPEQHEMLYGPEEPDPALHVRMLNDCHASLGAMVNVYGNLCRPPSDSLTWPRMEMKKLYPLMQQCGEQFSKAGSMSGEQYYRTLGSATGYYHEALREARRMADRVGHSALSAFARAAARAADRLVEPDLFMEAADGRPEKLEQIMLEACKRTRKRFGDELRKYGVTFDPPAVAVEHTYQPEGVTDNEY